LAGHFNTTGQCAAELLTIINFMAQFSWAAVDRLVLRVGWATYIKFGEEIGQ